MTERALRDMRFIEKYGSKQAHRISAANIARQIENLLNNTDFPKSVDLKELELPNPDLKHSRFTFDSETHLVNQNGVSFVLTPRESQVFTILLANLMRHVSKKEFQDIFQGFDDQALNLSVRTNVSRIRRKFRENVGAEEGFPEGYIQSLGGGEFPRYRIVDPEKMEPVAK